MAEQPGNDSLRTQNVREERTRFFEETEPFQTLSPSDSFAEGQNLLYPDPYADMPHKSKFAAGVLAFFIPGTGHFYLGLMQKGLYIMLAIILDIAAISSVMNQHNTSSNTNIPLLVLLGCLIPIIYFYNLFDALQSTDQVNAYRRAVRLGHIPPAPAGSDPLGRQIKTSAYGAALIAVGFFLFLISKKPAWLQDLIDMLGSYVGAVILIGTGLLLFLAESKKR